MIVRYPSVLTWRYRAAAIVIGLFTSVAGLKRVVTVDPRRRSERSLAVGDLSIQNLVVEYYSGGYALRPINGLNLDVAAGSLVMLRTQAAARRHCFPVWAAFCARGLGRSSSTKSTSRRYRRRAGELPA